MKEMQNKQTAGLICILTTALAFSTMEIAGKTLSDQINPFQITCIRFFIGGLFLLPFAIRQMHQQNIRLGISDVLFFFLTGAVGVCVSMSFFQLAIRETDASVVAVIFSTNPIFTLPLAAFFLHERMTKHRLIAFLMSLIGIILIFNPLSITADLRGILLALAAAVTFSFYTVMGRTRLDRYGGLILNSFSFLAGCVLLLIALLLFRQPVLSGVNGSNLPTLLYLGIFVTGVGYLCYFLAMKYTSVITASTVFFIKPALAPLLAFLILHEEIGPVMALGIALIILAAVFLFWGERRLPAE